MIETCRSVIKLYDIDVCTTGWFSC